MRKAFFSVEKKQKTFINSVASVLNQKFASL